MITAIIIGILVALLVAGGWFAYAMTLKVLADRDREKAQYKKALELEQARTSELLELVHKEYQGQVDALKEKGDQAYALGLNTGKRQTLEWIQRNVDAGSLRVEIIGDLSANEAEAPAPVAPQPEPTAANPFGVPVTQ